jgi:hypothetical protein
MKMHRLASFARSHRRLVSFIIGVGTFSVAVVAVAAIVSGNSTTGGSNHVTYTQLMLPVPSVSAGDVLIASVAVKGGTAAVMVTVPVGWTQIARADNDTNVSLISYWKVASASDAAGGASYTWTIQDQTRAEGGITGYSGVDTGQPIDVSSTNTGRGKIATSAGVTTTSANEEIISLFATDVGTTSASGYFSAPTTTSMTQKYNASNAALGPSVAAFDVAQAAAGNTGSISSATTDNKTRDWAAQAIALRFARLVHVVATGSQDNGLNSSGSFPVDSGGGTACFVGFGGHAGATTTSLTWGGNAMTEVARNDTVSTNFHADLWYIKNPPSGSQTLSYTFSTSDNAIFGWVCTTGEAASPIGAIDNTSGGHNTTTLPLSVTTTAPDSLIIGTLWNNNNAGTMSAVGPDVTLGWTKQETSPDTEGTSGLYQTTTATGTYTPQFSWTSAVNPAVGVGVEVLAQ